MIRDGKKTFADYFRKRPDPKELVRKWQADIRTEQRAIEKQLRWGPISSVASLPFFPIFQDHLVSREDPRSRGPLLAAGRSHGRSRRQ